MMQSCPLCQHSQADNFHQDKHRRYYRCRQCYLIYVDEADRFDAEAEKAHYDCHENNLDDEGYKTFLSRFSEPLLQRVGKTPQQGLDFGCGPGPLLAHMMREAGHHIELYDIYYTPDKSVLTKQYDFVSCTEAIEHFYQPQNELELLLSLIKPGGWLGIMTKLARDESAFATWHYKSDLTHVSFFSKATFEFVAQRYQLDVEFVGEDVILLRKTQ